MNSDTNEPGSEAILGAPPKGAKRILMVAFHYPPQDGGTGIHRTLKFSRYLSDHGWYPIVLSANPRAYAKLDDSIAVPPGVPVFRAFALDSSRHLAYRGRYFGGLAIPDQWMTWWPAGVVSGLRLIRRYKPDVIWSTHPIPTAHCIALALKWCSGLPWVADFRDPMTMKDPLTGEDSPPEPWLRRVRAWVETQTVRRCTRAVFTTPGTLEMYAERFPEMSRDHWTMIANGYDEEDFEGLDVPGRPPTPANEPLTLVHSGALYRSGRNPIEFFKAIGGLRRNGAISPSTVRVVLRAISDEDYYRKSIQELNIQDIVSIEMGVAHRKSVAEMFAADGLLLFQGGKFNRQIPAKVYEYLRAGRPILALTDARGDTAALLQGESAAVIASLDSEDEIARALMKFLTLLRTDPPVPGSPVRFSREARAGELAALLDTVYQNGRTDRQRR